MMLDSLKRFWKEEQAPTSVEYALMAAGIAVVIVAAVVLFGGAINRTFVKAANTLP